MEDKIAAQRVYKQSAMSNRQYGDLAELATVRGEVAHDIGRAQDLGYRRASFDEVDQPGESSGNAASNRTTQKLDEAAELAAEASTGTRPALEDLFELSRLGYSIHPKYLLGKATQAGVPAADVEQLQNSFCKYSILPVERTHEWRSSYSPACKAASARPVLTKERSYGNVQPPLFSAQPPVGSAGNPYNPFLATSNAMAANSLDILTTENKQGATGSHDSETLQKPRHPPLSSPRTVHSDGESKPQEGEKSVGLVRQLSLPDMNELNDLWEDLPQNSLDLHGLAGTGSLLPWMSAQGSLEQKINRAESLFRIEKDNLPIFTSVLQDLRASRRNRSIRLTTALSWNPEQAASQSAQPLVTQSPTVKKELVNKTLMDEPAGQSSGPGFYERYKDLPDKLEMRIVTAPSIFGVPSVINKGYKPPFTIRISMTSRRGVSLRATVTAFALQKDQTITCEKPDQEATKSVASEDFVFNDLKFNNSSRMKPRWLIFALHLPCDDLVYVQYRVPTLVMSRQCDQTPRAMAILQGEQPVRKRPRLQEVSEQQGRPRTPTGPWSPPVNWGPAPNYTEPSPHFAYQSASRFLPTSGTVQPSSSNDIHWPLEPPYIMSKWREAIQRVCRAFGLTRSFEQEDMHELAKVAGFISDYSTGSSGSSILSAEQWDRFGAWFLSYLYILKESRDLWMCPNMRLICGFAVTRQRATQLLSGQPNATFIVRPSVTLDSTMVISVVLHGDVHHLAINAHQLRQRSLVAWICSIGDIQHLLDIDSGVRYPKAQVFNCAPTTPQRPVAQSLPNHLAFGNYIPSTGQEALAQILDLSRRGSSGSLPGSYPLPVPQIGGGGYPGMAGGYEDPAGSGVHDLWMRSQRNDPDR